MKVVHANLARGWGGGERQTLLLMEGLRQRGIDGLLLARRASPLIARARAAGFDTVPLSKPFLLHGAPLGRGDLVHAHDAHAHQLAAAWKLVNRHPLVTTRRVAFLPGRDPITHFKYAQSDHIVAVSSAVSDVLAEWGVQKSKLAVIHDAIAMEDQRRPAAVEALRARFAGKQVVGCLASLVPAKDHATLLRAAARVCNARSGVVFVLIGDGPLRADLEVSAREQNPGCIFFEGFQDDPYSYFSVFDVFALTSREEGLGTAILDAFLYSVPVVATRAGGIPELVEDELTGLLCEAGDGAKISAAILRLLDDAALRDRLARAARQRLEAGFTADRMTGRYIEIYKQLVE